MKVSLLENRKPWGWASLGGYWPRGEVRNASFSLTDETGRDVRLQSEVTARWPDGSVKWSRHTFLARELGQSGELRNTPGAPVTGLRVTETPERWLVESASLRVAVPKNGEMLAVECAVSGQTAFDAAYPVLLINHTKRSERSVSSLTKNLPAVVKARKLEAEGPLETVFLFDGVHMEDGEEKMPFRIRMSLRENGEIQFDHTFFFKGDPQSDRLAGWGLRLETAFTGKPYQRYIRYLTDESTYHDNPTQLYYWRKHLDPALLKKQCAGETVTATAELDEAAEDLPRWDHFILSQDSADSCSIRKKAWEDGCWLEGPKGRRAPGGMAVSDPARTLCLHIRDFWEKHPAALETEALSRETTLCTAWFYSPMCEPFDFSHYDRRSYPMGTYEGFDYSRPDPNGIAVTCRLEVFGSKGYVPDEELKRQSDTVRRPPVYFASPEYYHIYKAFGPWSLPCRDTEVSAWAEDQISAACDFYANEVEQRKWYGLFNYGDFMHTYEAARHQWRWDVGGFAWDNTELAPTYWLWLQFLRTGSEKVFMLAEALSRHASDVDMYHFGYMKGLGSRHNVRHWGCPCKEPRVSMAGHHRPLYYLTGDRRVGDCLEDSVSAAESLYSMPWYTQQEGEINLRTGPDWAALVSDWMCAYERTLDDKYRKLIQTGIDDLKNTPLGLTSGPTFGFEPESGHLIYKGENVAGGGMHLQACMGETEIWLETADMLESRELLEMTANNGRYFYLSPEERNKLSGGIIGSRAFGGVIYSAEMQALAAKHLGDHQMGREIWKGLLALLYSPEQPDGFKPTVYAVSDDGRELKEIPWITTNFTAQWCLKYIVSMEFIPEDAPGTLGELAEALRTDPPKSRMYGA